MSYFTFDDVNVIDKLKSFGGQAIMTDRDTNIGGSVSNNYQDVGNRHLGQTYTYDNVNPKSIPINVVLIGTMRYINKCTDYLSTLVLTQDLHKLEFSDRANIVWEVKGDGQASISYSRDGSPFMATVSMTFVAPKAYGENKIEKSISTTQTDAKNGTIEQRTSSEYVLHVNNAGTAPTRPVISVNFKADNGYIGMYDTSGNAYEFGNIEELDTAKKQYSVHTQYFMDNQAIRTAWSTSQKNIAPTNSKGDPKNTGTTAVVSRMGFNSITLTSGTASSVSWDIPKGNDGNWTEYGYLWWRQTFWAGDFRQRGFMKVLVSDENGEFLYGAETIKRGFNADTEYNFLVTDGKGGYQILASNHFLPTEYDSQSPFNVGRGYSDILRQGNDLRFFWWGGYRSFTCPQLAGHKDHKIHFVFSNAGYAGVTHMLLRDFYYRQDRATKIEDIPNLFFNGSKFVLNNVDGSVTLNGINALSRVVHGSDTLLLKPGKSDIVLNLSDWNKTKPDITVSWKERFLR